MNEDKLIIFSEKIEERNVHWHINIVFYVKNMILALECFKTLFVIVALA